MLMDMWLFKFDIHEGTVAPNCLKSHTNSWVSDFIEKKAEMLDAQSEIHLARRNIVSTRQSDRL